MNGLIARRFLALREADKLGIAGYSVGSNVVLLEPVLHVDSARLVKVNALSLHDAHDLLLARVVQALARVAGFYVAAEVKRR